MSCWRGRGREQQGLTFEPDAGDQVLVGRDGVDALPLPQVPHLAGVVPTARGHVVAAKEGRESSV